MWAIESQLAENLVSTCGVATRCRPPIAAWRPRGSKRAAAARPMLVFIHGTGSHHGGFKDCGRPVPK